MTFGPSTRRRPLLVVLAILVVVVAGCSPGGDPEVEPVDQAPDTRTLHVVATTSILGDIAGNVVGDDAEIDVLIGSGIDPHQFEASAAQARLLRDADLVIANGLELEVRLTDVLEAAEADGANVLHLFEGIDDPIGSDDDGHAHGDDDDHGHGDDGHAHDDDDHAHDDDDDDDGHEDDAHAHDHGEWDPHVWFDPVRTAAAIRVLGEELAALDDSRPADEWTARADAYADEVLAVHAELEEILAVVPDERRKLLTNHEAFGYLADRYGFEVVGAIIPGGSTLAEPTAREFQQLAETIRGHDLPAIFAETTSPSRLAEALADEADLEVEVVVLYSESLGEPGSGAETYLGMLRVNAERIADALGG